MKLLSFVSCLLSASALVAAPSEAMRIYAEIQVTNKVLNLRNGPWLAHRYQDALKVATNADERAVIACAYAKFGYSFAMDDDVAKWRRMQVEAYNTPGASAATRLNLLKGGISGLDYETEGWKLVEKEPKLQQTYFWELIDRTRFGTSGLNEAGSAEHRLAVCEKAIALLGKDAMGGAFVSAKANTLRRLGRDADAEKVLLETIATTNARPRAAAERALGEFYAAVAQRYYAEPDAPTLRKALRHYEAALEMAKRFSKPRQHEYDAVIATAMKLRDWPAAKRAIDDYRAALKGGPDGYTAAKLGDYYYYQGDYAEAVKAYSLVPVAKFQASRPEHADAGATEWNRYAESLYATGRYAEALELVPKFVGWCSLADRNALYKRILKAKAESAK